MMMEQEDRQEQISLADLIPVQNNDPVLARLRSSGECQLLWAILEDAVECYLRYMGQSSVHAQQQFREAAEWIESDEEDWLCSFVNICRAFQIEPDYLRKKLRRHLQTIRPRRQVASLKRAA